MIINLLNNGKKSARPQSPRKINFSNIRYLLQFSFKYKKISDITSNLVQFIYFSFFLTSEEAKLSSVMSFMSASEFSLLSERQNRWSSKLPCYQVSISYGSYMNLCSSHYFIGYIIQCFYKFCVSEFQVGLCNSHGIENVSTDLVGKVV